MLWVNCPFKFKNKDVMKKDEHGNYLNDIYSVFNENKANLAERQIRYIGEKLWFGFTKNGNQKWVHLLQSIINDYNNKIIIINMTEAHILAKITVTVKDTKNIT